LAAGKSFALRLVVEEGETVFDDIIRGRVTVQHREMDDFVILRSDKSAVYHLAVVVDDHQMGISHVVRGEDHLSNTPKQILIYQAIGWPVPTFAHLPLIHGADGARLSKRHGATSVEEFKDSGILPDALVNYLCLLGWATGDDREILSREEIISIFSLDRVNKKNAVFDDKKLKWINGKYLSMQNSESLIELMTHLLTEDEKQSIKKDSSSFIRLIDLVKTRAQTIPEIYNGVRFFFHAPNTYDEKGIDKYFKTENSRQLLRSLRQVLKIQVNFESSSLETIIRNLADQLHIKAGEAIHPLRLALTGETVSPGIFEVIAILGKEKVIDRIDRALISMDDKISQGKSRIKL
jgi:glutamyl-tRNA synthetase